MFQSAPRVAAGRNCEGAALRGVARYVFQSAPRVAAGRNLGFPASMDRAQGVSIRSPRCRGEKHSCVAVAVVLSWFQSAPRVAAGRNERSGRIGGGIYKFQSAPRVAAGRNSVRLAPAARRGGVSIRSPRCRGEKLELFAFQRLAEVVSIRSPRCRGEKRGTRREVMQRVVFQSAPRVAAGRNCVRRPEWHALLSVSIRSPRCRGEKRRRSCHRYPWPAGFNPLPALPRGETYR